MPEYIDKNKALKIIIGLFDDLCADEIPDAISLMRSDHDVVKVTRCKNCAHYFAKFCACKLETFPCHRDEDDYCSKAERREEPVK